MKTTDIGHLAESAAANYLRRNGYKVIVQNWRTRRCEIDIVATKKNIVYFVEVKYRQSDKWGDGLDAITNKKLNQMEFAATVWICDNHWLGDYALAVASVSDSPPLVTDFIIL